MRKPHIFPIQSLQKGRLKRIGSLKKGSRDWKSSEGKKQGRQAKDQDKLRTLGNDTAPLDQRVFGRGHYLRPSMVQPFNATNVLIEGLTIKDSPFWVIHPTLCANVTVRGVTVDAQNANNELDSVDRSSAYPKSARVATNMMLLVFYYLSS